MSDDTSLRSPEDASRVSLSEDYEVCYWTTKWGVSREELVDAVDKVGSGVDKVAVYLGKGT